MRDPHRWAFRTIYTGLGACALAAAFLTGMGHHYTRIVSKPAYCTTGAGFIKCVEESAASAASAPVTATCSRLEGQHGVYTCELKLGSGYAVSCYDAAVSTAREGFPMLGTVNQRATC